MNYNNMKLNKTLMIAALVAGNVLAATVAVRAQDSTTPAAPATPTAPATPAPGARPPGARGAMNFEFVATQLALSDEQKTKAKPVFDEMRQKMGDLRKDTTLEQTERRAKMKEIRDDTNTKLKEIFTPEQYAKWQKMAPGARRPGGANGAPPAAAPAAPAAPKPPQ
jgi:Spy/CpxP family protein refolding chaperone